MSPIKILSSFGLLVLGFLASCTTPKESVRPNIIFIMSDDHSFQTISAYGLPPGNAAPTPQIDRIAKEGMRFDRCLVTNSICGPSRATLLTGKYNHKNGMLGNAGYLEGFDRDQQSFPSLMQESGYQTAMIGKWHLPSLPRGFDFWEILNGQGEYYNPEFIDSTGTHNTKGYVTQLITEKSLNWLKKAETNKKPFLLLMHHKAPHRTWQPEPKYLKSFEGISFPEPETLFDNYENRGTAARDQDMNIRNTMKVGYDLKMWTDTSDRQYKVLMERMNTEQQKAWNEYYNPIIDKFIKDNPQGDALVRWKYQRYMNDYLACIKSVDESVGRVLDYLKESGLDKNTIVIYTSDQGFYMGEHGWFDKRFIYEESLRTPFLIMWPAGINAGSVNKDLVSNLDFAETFLDLAGAGIPDDMQGKSLVPILKGNTPKDWRKEHYYHYYEYPGVHSVKRHYGIVTERFKLIHFYYDIDEWELYDLQKDPRELKNVYNDQEYSDIKVDLHERLDKLELKYEDTPGLNEPFKKNHE